MLTHKELEKKRKGTVVGMYQNLSKEVVKRF
jgi:hypothetical protein